jgi:hypothetical protein
MRRIVFSCLTWAALWTLACAAAWAANQKLYLTDGSYQIVREYKVEGDRVRYYSIERSDWEEIPKEMVDLKRTETEAATRQKELEKDAKMLSDEDRLQRELDKEVMRIPENPGVYFIDGDTTRMIKPAESTVHTSKGRSLLKVLSPMPVVSGRATLELQGPHSERIFTNGDQEFYIQLSDTERFGIAKLTPKGPVRIVEDITIVPVSKEYVEEPMMVDIFQKQMTPNGLYKIWARQTLLPGEYAVVEYTAGKMNMQVWDFAIGKAK